MKTRMYLFFVCLILSLLGKAQIIDTLIDVGGYSLHFHIVRGTGTPILLESGNGDDASVWKDLLSPIYDSTQATLITYDRSGLGSSSIDTSKSSLLQEIKGLETALGKLNYTKDIFWVSHSFGSYYSLLYMHRNAKKVKGYVLIDGLLPCYLTKQRAREIKDSISKEDWAMLKEKYSGLYYVLYKLEDIQIDMKDKNVPATIPTTVIEAETPPDVVKGNDEADWRNCLRTLGTQPNNYYVFAKNCRHKVWKDNPALVINEITKLYRQEELKLKK